MPILIRRYLSSSLRIVVISQHVDGCEACFYRFSTGTPISFTNKTDRQDKTEILLKVVLTITLF